GEGPIFILVYLGIVLEAKLQRIDADSVAQLVHGAFDGVYADGAAGRRHVARGKEIDPRKLGTDCRVIAVIERAGPRDSRILIILELRSIGDRVVLKRDQASSLVSPKR